jgi:hypothetical protein
LFAHIQWYEEITTRAYKTSSNNGAASQFDLNQTLTVEVDPEVELAAKTEDRVKVAVHHSPAVSLDRIFRELGRQS